MPTKQVTIIVNRIKAEREILSKGIDKPENIKQTLSDEYDIQTTVDTIERDVRDIHGGAYPDPWLDNFLSVEYPEIFKRAINDIIYACDNLKELTNVANNKQIRIMANNGLMKGQSELIKVLEHGPNVRMMKKLKIKTERLAKEVQEERKITNKNEEIPNIF